jgi:hypothetical protein
VGGDVVGFGNQNVDRQQPQQRESESDNAWNGWQAKGLHHLMITYGLDAPSVEGRVLNLRAGSVSSGGFQIAAGDPSPIREDGEHFQAIPADSA